MWAPLQLHWEGLSLRWLLAAERRLEGAWVSVLQSMGSEVAVRGLYSTGLVVLVHGLSCSAACGVFPDQGLNRCPPAFQGRFISAGPPGKSLHSTFQLPGSTRGIYFLHSLPPPLEPPFQHKGDICLSHPHCVPSSQRKT